MIRYNAYRGCHTPTRPLGLAPRPKPEPSFKAGTASRNRPFSDADDARLVALKKQGMKWTEIGEAIGRPPSSCRTRYFKLTGTLA